jgi:hypothetical protein
MIIRRFDEEKDVVMMVRVLPPTQNDIGPHPKI